MYQIAKKPSKMDFDGLYWIFCGFSIKKMKCARLSFEVWSKFLAFFYKMCSQLMP